MVKFKNLWLVSLIFLGGCAATNTAIEHRNLQTSSKMSESIFLEPGDNPHPKILVKIKNTTDHPGLEKPLQSVLETKLEEKGYKLTTVPGEADYMIQGNLLQIGKSDPEQLRRDKHGGFGSPVVGGLIGAGLGAAVGQSNSALLVGGVAGSAAGVLADNLVKDVMYSVITDLQISQRPQENQKVTSKIKSAVSQGQSTTEITEVDSAGQWIRYRTRVVSTAEKVNLKFAQAQPMLIQELASSVAGIF